MKKRIFSLVLCISLLFTMFAISVSAASVEVEQSLPAVVRFCPGTIIGDDTLETLPLPETYGAVFSKGWEVKLEGGDWAPYNGEVLDESYDGAQIRYYAITFSNNVEDYAYSNVCDLIVKHNPTGSYLYSGTDHWRVCADCGDKDGEELHDFFEEPTDKNTVCTICGAKRTHQWSGLASFFSWVLALIVELIG